jgi:hypothetical protein
MRALWLSLLLLSACSGYDDLALLELDGVKPPEIEPGTTLRIHGDGFPLGRSPEIRLRGDVYRPGTPKSEIDATLIGQVRSASLIEVPVAAELIDALGGRATVDGELRVGFSAAGDQRDVFAAERVRLDFLPDTAAQLLADAADASEEHDAASLRPSGFGITLSHEELGVPGVRVTEVEPGSLAARQGVRPDDRVVGLDGLTIYAWRDVAPDPSRTESTLYLTRDELRGVHALRWPHEALTPTAAPLEIATFVLLGLLLGWISPLTLWVRTSYAKLPTSVWIARAGLVAAFAALMLFVPALQWTTMWILGLGTFAALFALAARERLGTLSLSFAVASVLAVMLLTRSASISQIIAAQGPEALRWYAFQTPASCLAFVAYLHALALLSARPRLSASLYAAPAAVLGAVMFLGGWPLADPWVGVAVVLAKSVLLLLAAGLVGIRTKLAACISAAALALAAVGWFVDFDLLPQWSAMAIGVLCALGVRAVVPPLRASSAPVPA